MKYHRYTTKVKTADGKVYDLGERQYPPNHQHDKQGTPCPGCLCVNAWTEIIGEVD